MHSRHDVDLRGKDDEFKVNGAQHQSGSCLQWQISPLPPPPNPPPPSHSSHPPLPLPPYLPHRRHPPHPPPLVAAPPHPHGRPHCSLLHGLTHSPCQFLSKTVQATANAVSEGMVRTIARGGKRSLLHSTMRPRLRGSMRKGCCPHRRRIGSRERRVRKGRTDRN